MKKQEKSYKYLYSLQGIRALATIAIFLFHSGFLLKGTFPVTFFFMLSGFMMYYTKNEWGGVWKEWIIIYVSKKLRLFYPIHIITLLIAICISIPFVVDMEWIKSAVLNLFLLQSLVEKYAMGFNGLAWYLSVTIILYFVSHFLIKGVRRIKRVVPTIVFILVFIQFLNMISVERHLYLYSNPMYRVFDFVLGMLIAKLYLNHEIIIKRNTFCEFFIVGIFGVQYILSFFINAEMNYYSLLFAIALYVFAEGNGKISQILSRKPLQIVACYSFEFYMVHELMLRLFRKVFINVECFYPIKLAIIACPALVCSIILTVSLKRLEEKALSSVFLHKEIRGKR